MGTKPKIAIIGAGPAGCMLARLLHMAGIDPVVFEADVSPDYRSQGGSLDLHTNTGLLAFKEAGLWDEFMKYARYDSHYVAWVDRHAHPCFVIDGLKDDVTERPEIDRARLREILVESLPEGMIQWGHRLHRVEENGALVFDHAQERRDFDLIVGAEGAWSKVRNLLAPDIMPSFSGVGIHELRIPDVNKTAPNVAKFVNKGTVFGHADGKRFSIQTQGDGSVLIYTNSRYEDADWMKLENCGYDTTNLAIVKEILKKGHEGWDGIFLEAIDKAQGECKPRSLFMLPVGFTWQHRRGATLIGDAAHLMTPFAGEGVNVAFQDALELSRAIIASTREEDGGLAGLDTLDKAVEKVEKAMFPRMEKVQRMTWENTKDYFWAEGVPQSILPRLLARHVNFDMPWVLHPLVIVGMHAYMWSKSWYAYLTGN